MIHVFTSAAINYLPKVRVLCESLRRHHPEFIIHYAVADKIPEWLDAQQEPFDHVIGAEELDIENRQSWIFRHSLVEVSTGIKPYVLQKLLEQDDCDAVLYIDPDIVFFSRVNDLLRQLNRSNLVLTPHQTKPESDIHAIVDNEICSLSLGVFNLGFIGVRDTTAGRAFSKWWAERVYHFGQDKRAEGLFTDQKWINLAPVYFPGVKTLKSPRFNVAPWNLTTRTVTGSFESGFKVDGKALAFYHFTGFDSGGHAIMAEKNGGSNQSITHLIRWYAEMTSKAETEEAINSPWAYSLFDNGQPISEVHRKIYNERVDLQQAYPNPFTVSPDGNSYFDWFQNQGPIEYPDLILSEPRSRNTPINNKRWVMRKTLNILRNEHVAS